MIVHGFHHNVSAVQQQTRSHRRKEIDSILLHKSEYMCRVCRDSETTA